MERTVYIAWGFAFCFCLLWLISAYKLNRQSQFEELVLLNADNIHELIGITKTITGNTGGLIKNEK